jgi:hypothetical protein
LALVWAWLLSRVVLCSSGALGFIPWQHLWKGGWALLQVWGGAAPVPTLGTEPCWAFISLVVHPLRERTLALILSVAFAAAFEEGKLLVSSHSQVSLVAWWSVCVDTAGLFWVMSTAAHSPSSAFVCAGWWSGSKLGCISCFLEPRPNLDGPSTCYSYSESGVWSSLRTTAVAGVTSFLIAESRSVKK